MAQEWIQSVPNFSEGRDQETIAAIVNCFERQKGCRLLDWRADEDHNRLVVSIAGQPEPVQEALLSAAGVAIEKIDLTRHKGSHPRLGAVDVVPFTPLSNITMDACVALAHEFGRRFEETCRVPVYFYEEAALMPERRNLAEIRKGEFEALLMEISLPHRRPDVGKARLHPTAGATVIGARKFLVAFNVNLSTEDLNVAKTIAKSLRSTSGGLGYVKAIGLALSKRKMVQVSCNVTDFEKTPLYRVVEFVRTEARRWGIAVADTEIYGMVPWGALLSSAAFYLQANGLEADQVIEERLLVFMGEEEQ